MIVKARVRRGFMGTRQKSEVREEFRNGDWRLEIGDWRLE
jgi:hypothetical protein